MGVGIIAWHHNGHVRASMCTIKPYVLDPIVAEALTAQQWVELCRDLGIQSILLEGDAKEIVLALKTGGDSLGSYGSIIAYARNLPSHFCHGLSIL
jgi:hypothetical protein